MNRQQGIRRRVFTGRHMTAILVAFFGVVIAVNITMARFATGSFGGIVVENSYVASQQFNGWLQQAEQQRQWGWGALTAWRPDGRLMVTVTGAPADVTVHATARHPLGRMPDQALDFEPQGGGRFLSRSALPEGRWTLRLQLAAGAREWKREEELR
ncbi:hypothetical protein GRI97_02985 [Altererythrobacter xixiisoli]|uniref:Nitrogen fixation protein FixH n=1 Tax=Croceibacterium xixiisoli TaxID=1476466 RepID=A0A6I4TUL0_9SPHN|nr:FixH family protein [Croceibacterium xixiisoli]MXO97953.1 hypothetical protein [Croceibacterium xixiisoli]